MKNEILKQDVFIIENDNIVVYSKNGNKYFISKEGVCSCKRYGFKRTCRHLEQVQISGMLEQLQTKDKTSGFSFITSPVIKKMRLKAIKQYLEKHLISFDDNLLDKIETIVTPQTKPEEILRMI